MVNEATEKMLEKLAELEKLATRVLPRARERVRKFAMRGVRVGCEWALLNAVESISFYLGEIERILTNVEQPSAETMTPPRAERFEQVRRCIEEIRRWVEYSGVADGLA